MKKILLLALTIISINIYGAYSTVDDQIVTIHVTHVTLDGPQQTYTIWNSKNRDICRRITDFIKSRPELGSIDKKWELKCVRYEGSNEINAWIMQDWR